MEQQPIIINQLQIRQVNRQPLDIANYLSAITSAESTQYPSRARLYDIYTHALLDGHLHGVITKRIDSVLNKPLFYKDKKGGVVEELNPIIQSAEFRKIMRLLLESILWGISGIEFIPGKQLAAVPIPRKHIKPHNHIIAVEQFSNEGVDYNTLPNVWIFGEKDNLGVLLQATTYVIYKRNAISDWANFVEIFGIPIRIAKYDVFDKETQEALKDALDNSGSALSMLIPKQAEFEVQDGKTANANGDLQANFVETMNEHISITILGNTETTSNGKTGSQAKSKVHQEQQNQIVKSDMALLQAALNDPKFIAILQSYNLPVTNDGNFEFNKDIDIAFLAERIKIDKELIAAGLPIPNDYFYETYNIPKPDPNQPIISPPDPSLRGGSEATNEATLSFNQKNLSSDNNLPNLPSLRDNEVGEATYLQNLINKSLSDFFA
ncbi:DUF935 family protein [bacterium]|nr:DUF935 family protein [bacterium]